MSTPPARAVAAVLLPPLGALALYAALWVGYRQDWGWLAAVDSAALRAAYDVGSAHPGWVAFWDALCAVFAPVTFRVVGMAAIAVALVAGRLRTALFLMVSVELTELVTRIGKGLAGRPRPDTALAAASSSSFPSGHAFGTMVGVAALLAVLLPLLHRPARATAVLAGALIVLAVGAGRVILNVHHPTDVLAGWALGYAYVTGCWWLTRPAAERKNQQPKAKNVAPRTS